MRHASTDAARIGKNQWPKMHYTTSNTWMRHASVDASRIQTSHIQTIKQTEGSFSGISSVFPPFPPQILRSRFWDWDPPFSHLERVLLVLGILIFAGFAGSDDCIWIVKNWRRRAAEHEIGTETCLLRVFLFFTLLFLYFSWFDWKNVRSGHVWLSFL